MSKLRAFGHHAALDILVSVAPPCITGHLLLDIFYLLFIIKKQLQATQPDPFVFNTIDHLKLYVKLFKSIVSIAFNY
jgi:hypothetical protein